MTIREMFQKIEKAGFADVEIRRGGEGLEIIEDNPMRAVVQKDITSRHMLVYDLNMETGEAYVEEYKATDDDMDMECVCRTVYDASGEPFKIKAEAGEYHPIEDVPSPIPEPKQIVFDGYQFCHKEDKT